MLPGIVLAAGGVMVATAITFYFVSNDANAKREELLREMEATLDALLRKAEALKEAARRSEAATQAAAAENCEMRKNHEELEKELAHTEKELADLKAELARWRASSGTFISGFSLVSRSNVLYHGKWQHDKVVDYLHARREDAQQITLQLASSKI